MAFVLRPYQQDMLEAVFRAWDGGMQAPLGVLPTGGGKTVVFAHIPKLRPDKLPMLVLAHREELLTQARDKISAANPDLEVAIEQGANYAGRAEVVVASVPTLGRAGSRRLEEYPKDFFKCIVVDEAHHAAAQSYRRILDYFENVPRLGVTATPQRSDNTRLTDVFDEIVYYRTIREMIDEGYLAPLRGWRVHTEVDISGVPTTAGDFNDAELAKRINTPGRNLLAVESYEKLAPGTKALVFTVDVAHARDLAKVFHDRGHRVRFVHGGMPKPEREAYLQALKDGRLDVLVNCMVLTEGFDEPSVQTILMARPTRSQLLYTQIVGRGLRLYETKESCLVIDLADTTANKIPVGLPTLMGLPPDYDLAGEDLSEEAKEWDKLAEKAPESAAKARSREEIYSAYEQIDLFAPPPPNPALLEFSSFIWMEMGPDRYALGLGSGERITIVGDALGRWNVFHQEPKKEAEALFTVEELTEAFRQADAHIEANYSSRTALLTATAGWRGDPPTDKQLKLLKKHGIPITTTMTKGEASQILDKIFAENPRKPRPAWVEEKIARQRRAKGF